MNGNNMIGYSSYMPGFQGTNGRNQINPEKQKEMDKLRKVEKIEQEHFVERIKNITFLLQDSGFTQEQSVQLAIAFYNDPVFQKKRAKRKSMSEIILDD